MFAVEVAPEVIESFPPETTRPPVVFNPPPLVVIIPELKVEVAPDPPTLSTDWIVEEPAMMADEEAFNSPPTWRLDANVEEAAAIAELNVMRLLEVSTVKTDEDAEFSILNALAVLTKVWIVVEP